MMEMNIIIFERQKSERWRKPNKLSDETNERGEKERKRE